ncbi:MAG: 3-deoxy-D-manno-octulosonic acid transferase [Candidatus Omnitrophota bacterium]
MKGFMLRLAYDAAFLAFSFIYLPYLILKGKAHADFGQRFGILPDALKGGREKTVWVHTVSVGEVMAASVFVKELAAALPGYRVVVSTTTRTGQETAKKILTGIRTFYFPLDFQITVRKTVDFIKPDLFVVFETELWPNLITELYRRKVPVFLVNGRISDRSFSGYRLLRPFLSPVLGMFKLLMMQTADDAARMKAIGAPAGRIVVTGNVKYDTESASEAPGGQGIDRGSFGISHDEKLIVCGSTHRGEEEVILSAYAGLLKAYPGLRLLLAPRHVERADEVDDLCREKGFTPARVSKKEPGDAAGAVKPVIILDTIGQLARVYGMADIVFVGGSLVKKGGHNIIEPAQFSKPIIFGPHMSNFRNMAERFVKRRAAVMLAAPEDLEGAVAGLISDRAGMDAMGENARKLVEENKGAVGRALRLISENVAGDGAACARRGAS